MQDKDSDANFVENPYGDFEITFSIGTPFMLAQMVRGIKRGQHPL